MQIPRWRNLLLLRNPVLPTFSSRLQHASIHSTPATCEKWKNRWNSDIKGGQKRSKDTQGGQKPSKTYARYAVRQKRADAKRALKNLLFDNDFSIKNKETWNIDVGSDWDDKSEYSKNTGRTKFSSRRAKKSHYKKMKHNFRRDYFSEDADNPETIFHAKFGTRYYSWSFQSWQDSFRSSTSGFEWRENSEQKRRTKKWDSYSESESEYESFTVGSSSDRKALGLPPTGPLKIEDVKNAFRLSALKWHPDKHQGPSQEMVEEKFKMCVDSYKSLCSALSGA